MATTSAHEYLTQSETLARYKDKLAGCLIGMAIGDALGATMEGEDAPNVAQFVQQANVQFFKICNVNSMNKYYRIPCTRMIRNWQIV